MRYTARFAVRHLRLRELSVVIITAVYIPPDAKVNTALSLLLNTVNEQQRAHPDGVHIIAGDFNKANLKTVLPKFYQHVKCSTRGKNTLDHVYTNIKHAYRATPLPQLGQSDHLSLLLSPTYTPIRRQARPITKTVMTWPDDALPKLQDCFQHTDWDLFQQQELETATGTVLDYIKFCIGNVTVEKNIRVYPNKKPWMTSQVRTLLRARDAAFRSGDRALYSVARADLKRGIKKAKADHRRCIESHLSSKNSREVWRGIHDITNFRGCNMTTADQSATLAEELNCFFARFETPQRHSSAPALPPPPPGSGATPLTAQCQTSAPGCEPQEGYRTRRTTPRHPLVSSSVSRFPGSPLDSLLPSLILTSRLPLDHDTLLQPLTSCLSLDLRACLGLSGLPHRSQHTPSTPPDSA
ncbi:uncharacterized protein [Nerophis lumbriciformis]|uniref:uncharacterized protein n=1 Tax=Nerophis lumbriciformis TaxID=546530 RepID=UPI003BA87B16